MKTPKIFEYSRYLDFLRSMILHHKHIYGYKAKLAEVAGCQRSFLSQVLANQAHLNLEHAIELARFWELSNSEKEYFLTLVSVERTTNKSLKEHLSHKLESARKEQENLLRRFEQQEFLPDAKAAVFYSSWHYLAIAILLTIPKFKTVKAISQRLNLGDEVVEESLTQMSDLGLVLRSGTEWALKNKTFHLPKESKFTSLSHSNWRVRAVQDSLLSKNHSVHYTSVCSVSISDAEKLRQLVFQFIDQSRRIVEPSKEEELFCLSCDWFKV